MQAVVERFGAALPMEIVVGGLRAGNTVPMDATLRNYVQGHWEKVYEASGQRFNFAFKMPEGFIYDTEPPCRALKVAQEIEPKHVLTLSHAIQKAFYVDNRDVTQEAVLAKVAQEAGLDGAVFAAALGEERFRAAAQADFRRAREELNVCSFPTLLGENARGVSVVSPGFCPPELLIRRVQTWLDPYAS
ncbi:putative protein-disulfide isomerase [Magnetofaba australis IT-1]|uniref:Thioredoxin-like fold domain-containing protein n=2 Tax=Magnetofaba TaxID=1472292 RepID=A0A1Y2K277_9PROT|nr:putative protein-disulfide isomerase [Magnetofaba australis IT-1]